MNSINMCVTLTDHYAKVSSTLDLLSEPLGILFQEYSNITISINGDRSKTYTYLRFMWVVAAFIIVVSYSGNLKVTDHM